MPKNLVELIKASGKAGIAGQSFANDVTDAAVGVAMTDYLVGAPTFFDPPAPETVYTSGQTISLGITFGAQGSKYASIRPPGTQGWLDLGTAQQVITAASWTGNTVTLSITVTGDYDDNTVQTLTGFSAWFTGYTNPNEPPSSTWEDVSVTPTVAGPTTPTGSTTKTLQYLFNPDIAEFNPSVYVPSATTSWPITITRIAHPSWTTRHEWELHGNDSYTYLLGGNGYTFASHPNTDFPNANPVGWIRYRLRAEYGGNGQWTNYGYVTWTDPRPDF